MFLSFQRRLPCAQFHHFFSIPLFYLFRFHCARRYGNTVRALSAIHVCLFALALAGAPLGAVQIGAALVLADLCLFVVSANVSPLALACTSALWLRRGPVVPAVPYKVMHRRLARLARASSLELFTEPLHFSLFSFFFALSLVEVVFVFYAVGLSRIVSGAASQREVKAAAAGFLVNSAMLAALRF